MKEIEGYKLLRELPGNTLFKQYEALDLSTSTRVIIKMLSGEKPDQFIDDWNTRILIKEYESNRLLFKKGITPACVLKEVNMVDMLVYSIAQAVPLADVIGEQVSDYGHVYCLALEICRQLELSHERGFAHYNLNPRSVLIDKQSGGVKFISYCTIASYDLFCELPYVAPEQTGKLTMKTDFRSDFYSLGLILYQMVAGYHPIKESDAKTICRRQITDRFTSLKHLDETVPTALSDIIDKLTAKQASSRYQNATSLKYDLMKAFEFVKNDTPWRSFGLGSLDYISNIELPRPNSFFEREKDDIISTIKKAPSGVITIINLPGSLSQGKDEFVRDIIRLLDANNIFNVFITALKVNKSLPYHTVSGLIREMAHVMRNGSIFDKREVKQFFHLLPNQQAVALLKLCPHFVTLFDVNVDQRYQSVDDNSIVCAAVRHFINFVTSKTRPLLVYVEDVEYTDTASLKLFVELQKEGKVNNFILFQMSRQPIDPSRFSANTNIQFQQYDIPQLSAKKITSLVNNVFNLEGDDASALVSLIEERTKGKITHVNAFLTQVIELKFLSFDREGFVWRVDEQSISRYSYSARYSSIIANRFNQLNNQVQHLLVECACIGYTFDICLLQKIHGYNIRSISNVFKEILVLGLIEPVEKFSSLNNPNNPVFYKFKNIKIYEFFCKLAATDDNVLLGSIFSSIIESSSGENNYLSNYDEFVKINHTLVAELTGEEQVAVMTFYFKKADRFFYLNKWKEAAVYITYCLQVVKTSRWDTHQQIVHDVHLLALKIFSRTRDFKQSDALFATVILNTVGHQRVLCMKAQVESLISRGKNEEATSLLASLLAQVGYRQQHYSIVSSAREYVVTLLYRNKLFNNEILTDGAETELADDVLAFVNLNALLVNQALYRHTLNLIREAVLTRGIHSTHMLPLLVEARQMQDNPSMYPLSVKTAATIVDSLVDKPQLFEDELYYYFVHFAVFTGRLSHVHFAEHVRTYNHHGNIKKLTGVCAVMSILDVFDGKNLDIIKQDTLNTLHEIKSYPAKTRLVKLLTDLVSRIQALNVTLPRGAVSGGKMPNDPVNVGLPVDVWNEVLRMMQAYLAGDVELVRSACHSLQLRRNSPDGVLPYIISLFYDDLCTLTDRGVPLKWSGGATNTGYFRKLARYSPFYFKVPYLMLCAARFNRLGLSSMAINTFRMAIDLCEQRGQYHFCGLSNIMVARVYRERGDNALFSRHVMKAYIAFKCWGAELVAERLKADHPTVFEGIESSIYPF